tara:strand:+ start:799 stop:3270 length:2472 start_codon:yes stop_codon:yes gene_type:complete
MAGISYETTYTSLNGWGYKLQIWDRNWNGETNSFNISDTAAVIKYDSGGDDKMNPLMASSMCFDFIVENSTQQAYINLFLRPNTAQEKDIYFILYKTKDVGYEMVWGGFMISDLDTTTDEFYPYIVKLEAIDGIALLKDIPFVKNALNADVGPFTLPETYMGYSNGSWNNGWISTVDNTKYKKIIHVLTEAIQYSGFAGMSNNYSGIGAPTISSSVNWWNQAHQASYIGTEDPLDLSRINMTQFYKLIENSSNTTAPDQYQALSCYDAIVNICRCWGLKCFYWGHKIYFVQVGLYNTAETGTTASPVNIKSKIYNILGVPESGIRNFIGDTNMGRYQFSFNSTNTGKLQRLAGTTYDEYPVIKKVVTEFPSISNNNLFTTFPLIYGQTDTPHEWPYNSDGIVQTTTDIGTISDPNTLDGLYVDLFLQFTNTGTTPVDQVLQFTIQARPTNGNYTTQGKIPLYNANTSSIVWKDTSINTQTLSPQGLAFTTDYLGTGTQSYVFSNIFSNLTFNNIATTPAFNNSVLIPLGTNIINVVDGTVINTLFNNIIPFDSTMSGDWDFRIITITSDTNTNTTAGGIGNGVTKGHGTTSNISNNWGQPSWDNLPNGQKRVGSPNNQLFYGDVYYTNQNSTTFPNTIAIVNNGSIGSVGQQTQITLSNTDSFIVDIPATLWGDCETNDANGSIQVYNGTNWVYTDFLGKWGRNIVTGTDSLTELLCKETLFIQNKPSYTANYVTVVGVTEPNINNDADFPYFVNPISRLRDTAFNNKIFVPINLEIDTINNQVSGKWFEMAYVVSSGAVLTTTNLSQKEEKERSPSNLNAQA